MANDSLEAMASFNWVQARSECSVERVFQILAEVVDSDVKAANALNRRGVTFHVNRDARGKLIVARNRDLGGFSDVTIVVFELEPGRIVVTRKTANIDDKTLFSAAPSLNEQGQCLLEVAGDQLQLWQVSRRALEDLFFEF